MPLTDVRIRAAKATEKPYKLADAAGLYLYVKPNGSRLWRFKYRYSGKEKVLALGGYAPGTADHVSLVEARHRHADAKRQLRDGIDPSAAKQAEKFARADRAANSLEMVAREWHRKQAGAWSTAYGTKELGQLERHVFPQIGHRAIAELRPKDLLVVLNRIEESGKVETAHRVRRSLAAIWRYAIVTGRTESDPTTALKGALAAVKRKHFASIVEPTRVGELIRAIRSYGGSSVVRLALQLQALTFVRPSELRTARWEEFEFDVEPPAKGKKPIVTEPLWRIPPQKMKMGEQHIVPLSNQAVSVLRQIHAISGPKGLLFPSIRNKTRPMSENTINAALRASGFAQDQMTGHGFRHMASTLLHEQGFNSLWIERQLAHGDRDEVRAVYNFAEYLPERRRMMQRWADYLDSLAAVDSGKPKARR